MKDIFITPYDKGKYMLKETLTFSDGTTIKAGFISNGASVPRIFYWLIPPFIKAVFLHDYWCDKEQYRKADTLFNKELKAHPHSKRWRRLVFITGVKSWHFVAYKKNNSPRWYIKFIIFLININIKNKDNPKNKK